MDHLDHPLLLDRQFDAQAERTPDGIALHAGAESITYADLQARSERFALRLHSEGVRGGGYVGLHMERSIDFVVGMLGILRLQCAVVPLPPSYPQARLREILLFAALDAVVDDERTPLPRQLRDGAIRFSTDHAAPAESRERPSGRADQPAFVLCSSGSTGTPKMIVRSHRSFFHRLRWTWDNHPYGSDELCCQKSHMTTTHSLYELLEPLLRGTPTRIIPDDEVRSLESFWETVNGRGVTRLLLVPSMLSASLAMPGFAAPRLRVLVLMGEEVSPQLTQRALRALPRDLQIYSIYGSTEASSTLVCDLRAWFMPGEALPLGTPISPDVQVSVLREDLTPVAPGETGMLHIAGSALFTEYFRSPELTAAAFVPGAPGGQRLFRTHDQVRLTAQGDLLFVGRTDHVVKIRGFRVDVREVEQAVLLHPGVTECAVLPSAGVQGDTTLRAFVTPPSVDAAALQDRLRELLPAYMVPSNVARLGALPRTASGKIDRQRLLAGEAAPPPGGGTPTPGLSNTERQVYGVWCEVLGRSDVAPGSTFFELGGTSLTVFAAVHRLRTAFGLERNQLPELSLYRHPTIESMARHIDGLGAGVAPRSDPANAILVPLKQGESPDLPPLFVIASAGGTLGAYQKVVGALSTRRAIIGVRDPFLWGERDPTRGFQDWVGSYVQAIREQQPGGPYHVAAYSSAGAFGYEIAQRLRRAGEEVAVLILIDPLAIDRGTKWRFGHWALEARFRHRYIRQAILLGGALRALVPRRVRPDGRAHSQDALTLTRDEFQRFSIEARTNLGHLLNLSALLELTSGLPFALKRADFQGVEQDQYMRVLLDRVKSLVPDVDAETIQNLVVQYQLQVRTQHRYRLQPYDGRVVIFEPRSPYNGLLRAQFRPYVRDLRVRAIGMSEASTRPPGPTDPFSGGLRSHYLSMRDMTFAHGLAKELDELLR